MMLFLTYFLIAFVAFLHIYFMILEVFFWDKPKGLKTFGLTLEEAKISKTLAKNQGLYNGFLAAGLLWAILDKTNFSSISLFFLTCVALAGIYGAFTTKKIKLFYVQAIPAIIAILAMVLTH